MQVIEFLRRNYFE